MRFSTDDIHVRILDLSAAAYDEIRNKLIDAGYDYLVWPPTGRISLRDFIITCEELEKIDA